MLDIDRLYTIQEVARILAIHKVTVHRKIKAGDLAVVRIGTAVRIKGSEIARVMEVGM